MPSLSSFLPAGLFWSACLAVPLAVAADVVVSVSGVPNASGSVGCGLFSGERGFPMDNSAAQMVWLPADPKGVSCVFADVAPGPYAVSVLHDRNGNRKVNTNFVGMPKEAWGVSNNVRPTLRPPRFDEAAFKVETGRAVALDVKVAK
jgi:uncharacterized protein (DUF2141 family)